MNPISKALDHIKFTIPIQVLQETFRDPRPNWRRAPISIDEMIRCMIINPRVLVDCNLVGGRTVPISLEGLVPEFVDQFTAVYNIPKERTEMQSILAVLSIGYLPVSNQYGMGAGGYGYISPGSSSEINKVADRVANAVSSIPAVSNANCQLIAENTVVVRDQYRITSTYVLRCILENDSQLNNISPRSYLNFCKLVELAVKSYIYNTLVIRIDQAYLQGGQELGALKAYVETLSDAESMYQTYLAEQWRPTAFMNDQPSYNRHIKLMISPGI
jgi:hypothetical protein